MDTSWPARSWGKTHPCVERSVSKCGGAVNKLSIFSSVQFKVVSMRSERPAHMRSTPSLRSFPNVASPWYDLCGWLGVKQQLSYLILSPQCCPWNSSNVGLNDDGPFSSSQGRSLSAFSFYDSPLQATDGVMSLALCRQVVCQAPQSSNVDKWNRSCEWITSLQMALAELLTIVWLGGCMHSCRLKKKDLKNPNPNPGQLILINDIEHFQSVLCFEMWTLI